MQVPAHHHVHTVGKAPARRSPLSHLSKLQVHYATELGGSEVLVSDGVPPLVQQGQILFPSERSRVMVPQPIPQSDTETTKVRSEAARLGVAPVQLAAAHEFGPN